MTIYLHAKLESAIFDLVKTKTESFVDVIALQPRQSLLVEANHQILLVLEGLAWITMDGQDYVGQVGDCYILTPTKDACPVRISAMGNNPLIYFLK